MIKYIIFFSEFWSKLETEKPDYFCAQIANLRAKYPEMILLDSLIGVFFNFDSNAFYQSDTLACTQIGESSKVAQILSEMQWYQGAVQ